MKNKQFNELAVCGIEAVKALERSHPEAIKRLYFTAERAPHFGGLCKKLAARKIPYNCVQSTAELEKLSGSIHHQGVVAMIAQPEIPRLSQETVDEWIAKPTLIIMLDRVGNSNNFGAIVRSAAFFGVTNMVIPLDEAQSTVNTSAFRTAQGGMECMNIFCAASLSAFLKTVEQKIIRIGTDVYAQKNIRDLEKLDATKSVLLILGNEETGISPEIKALCDITVKIEGAPFFTDSNGVKQSAVQSLNVAQSASIFLYELGAKFLQ